jgi:hypothetical protein
MDPIPPRDQFMYRKVEGPYLEVRSYPGAVEFARPLVEEIGEDWPVFERSGVGIDPVEWAVLISVPTSLFFGKFVELAATDAYAALKSWLHRLVPGRGYIELRDEWGQSRGPIEMPATDEHLRHLVGVHLASAMVTAGDRLEEAGDPESLRRAKLLYEAAAELRPDETYVVAPLLILMKRFGDPASLEEAEGWYRRALEQGLTRDDLDREANLITARRQVHREVAALAELRDRGLLSDKEFEVRREEVARRFT